MKIILTFLLLFVSFQIRSQCLRLNTSEIKESEYIYSGISDTVASFLDLVIVDEKSNCVDSVKITSYGWERQSRINICNKNRPSFNFPIGTKLRLLLEKEGFTSREIINIELGSGDIVTLKLVLSRDTLEEISTINLSKKIKINWNNKYCQIENDSILKKVENDFEKIKFELVQTILDTTEIKENICHINRKLKKGDVAYLLLSLFLKFSDREILDTQFDSFSYDCPYPDSFFSAIDIDRKGILKRIQKHLK